MFDPSGYQPGNWEHTPPQNTAISANAPTSTTDTSTSTTSTLNQNAPSFKPTTSTFNRNALSFKPAANYGKDDTLWSNSTVGALPEAGSTFLKYQEESKYATSIPTSFPVTTYSWAPSAVSQGNYGAPWSNPTASTFSFEPAGEFRIKEFKPTPVTTHTWVPPAVSQGNYGAPWSTFLNDQEEFEHATSMPAGSQDNYDVNGFQFDWEDETFRRGMKNLSAASEKVIASHQCKRANFYEPDEFLYKDQGMAVIDLFQVPDEFIVIDLESIPVLNRERYLKSPNKDQDDLALFNYVPYVAVVNKCVKKGSTYEITQKTYINESIRKYIPMEDFLRDWKASNKRSSLGLLRGEAKEGFRRYNLSIDKIKNEIQFAKVQPDLIDFLRKKVMKYPTVVSGAQLDIAALLRLDVIVSYDQAESVKMTNILPSPKVANLSNEDFKILKNIFDLQNQDVFLYTSFNKLKLEKIQSLTESALSKLTERSGHLQKNPKQGQSLATYKKYIQDNVGLHIPEIETLVFAEIFINYRDYQLKRQNKVYPVVQYSLFSGGILPYNFGTVYADNIREILGAPKISSDLVDKVVGVLNQKVNPQEKGKLSNITNLVNYLYDNFQKYDPQNKGELHFDYMVDYLIGYLYMSQFYKEAVSLGLMTQSEFDERVGINVLQILTNGVILRSYPINKQKTVTVAVLSGRFNQQYDWGFVAVSYKPNLKRNFINENKRKEQLRKEFQRAKDQFSKAKSEYLKIEDEYQQVYYDMEQSEYQLDKLYYKIYNYPQNNKGGKEYQRIRKEYDDLLGGYQSLERKFNKLSINRNEFGSRASEKQKDVLNAEKRFKQFDDKKELDDIFYRTFIKNEHIECVQLMNTYLKDEMYKKENDKMWFPSIVSRNDMGLQRVGKYFDEVKNKDKDKEEKRLKYEFERDIRDYQGGFGRRKSQILPRLTFY